MKEGPSVGGWRKSRDVTDRQTDGRNGYRMMCATRGAVKCLSSKKEVLNGATHDTI